MKKLLALVMTLFFSLNMSLTAFSAEVNESNPLEVIHLIDAGLDENFNLIQEKASSLSSTEKFAILQSKESSPVMPFALNFLLGFGMGSFVQGNQRAGFFQLATELIGGVVAVFFFSTGDGGAAILAMLGIGVAALGRLVGLISPFNYSKEYNKKLQEALLGNRHSTSSKEIIKFSLAF